MKRYLLLIITLLPIFAFAANSFDRHTWRTEQGGYLRVWHHAPVPTQITAYFPPEYAHAAYSISYSYSLDGGAYNGSSDVCKLTSPTSLKCITGETVNLDISAHTATLVALFGGGSVVFKE